MVKDSDSVQIVISRLKNIDDREGFIELTEKRSLTQEERGLHFL